MDPCDGGAIEKRGVAEEDNMARTRQNSVELSPKTLSLSPLINANVLNFFEAAGVQSMRFTSCYSAVAFAEDAGTLNRAFCSSFSVP